MTLTEQQKELDRLNELDRKRSDGEWRVCSPIEKNNDIKPKGYYVYKPYWGCIARPHQDSPQWPHQEENMRFIAAAPDMIALINEQAKTIELLVGAIQRVIKWKGEFPESERFYDDGTQMSYGAAYGSNGERDYMRDKLKQTLKELGVE